MKSIGGFFDLELPPAGPGPHPGAVALSTGRACMGLWIQDAQPERCYVPFYCCDALIQPLQEAGIPFEFYSIDEQLCPKELPEEPGNDEWLVWTNFFGLLGNRLEPLSKAWGGRILVDNTHAFFEAFEPKLWSFTSARKYFGVPDGAYCYRPDGDATEPDVERFVPDSACHLVARYTRKSGEAFSMYQEAEEALDCSLKRISKLSEKLMSGVDIESARMARHRNYEILVEHLSKYNTFSLANCAPVKTPFCYPFLPAKPIARHNLYKKNIFVPTLWSDVENREVDDFELERRISRDLLPLPIDHRYKPNDMLRLASIVLDNIW
ncbi:hypothetical protein [Vreelandella utahensis]|uniref:hypothetical protein n=1 Tax=Vreelandella halophila TaxID=86177 RepID=UPI0011799679|nr:hypothetical protein [Halomonas utahensis]